MQIYEIKNDTAEILYAPEENNLFLSDFLFIEDNYSTIVSQVTDISTTNRADINLATVKFYLSVDKNNKLTQYNGHTPSKNSDVGFLDADEIIGLFRPKYNEINWGQYARKNDITVATDLKFFSSGCAVICDREEQSINIIDNIVNSFKKSNIRFLLLDFEGKYKEISAENNAVFGENYRIPLDNLALDYIFENDLNDCPIDAKALIQGIILAVQKYISSSEDGFIPFNTFLNIVLSESKKSNNSGLTIFGNKLLKYRQKQIFADNKNQFAAINQCGGSFKLDLSGADEHFYPLIFKSIINNIQKKFYVISDIIDENAVPSTLKYIYEKSNIRLIPILNHGNKNLDKIKSKCSNIVVFPPANQQKSEEPYSILLEKITNKEFIIWGENTLFIPLVVYLDSKNQKIPNSDYLNTDEDITLEDLNNLDRVNLEAVKEALKLEKTSSKTSEQEILPQTVILEENKEEEAAAEEEKKNLTEENIIEINENIPEDNFKQENSNSDIEIVEEINNNTEVISEPKIQEQPKEQQVPASELKNELKIKNTENTEPKQPKRPIPDADKIKVYEPKEPTNPTTVTFNEGDRVSHAKHGTGIVEKIIKYGNKTLCSIQFDKVGRRLLDPNITIIEKL